MPGSAPGGGRDSAELEIDMMGFSVHKDHIVAMLKVAVTCTLHHIHVSCTKVCIGTLMKSTFDFAVSDIQYVAATKHYRKPPPDSTTQPHIEKIFEE